MSDQRDQNGQTEAEFLATYNGDAYPKPAVTADVCVFAEGEEEMELLMIRRGGHPFLGCWALPGGFANRNEPLEETAARELSEETGITDLELELVGVYSAPGRDPRGWTVTAAYGVVVEKDDITVQAGDDAAEARWFRLSELPEVLAFDHADIIRDACEILL